MKESDLITDENLELRSKRILVVDDSFFGKKTADVGSRLRSGMGKPDPSDRGRSLAAHQISLKSDDLSSTGGLRNYLPKDFGEGYWDTIEIAPGFLALICDANYRKEHRVVLPAESLIKIRVVQSGNLTIPSEQLSVGAGTVMIQRVGGDRPIEYVIERSDEPFQMVVLHIVPEALGRFGVLAESIPQDFGYLLDPDLQHSASTKLESSAYLLRVARDMIESRQRMLSELRHSYLMGRSYELVAEIFSRVSAIDVKNSAGNSFRRADIVALHEAKRILVGNLKDSPTISQLARLIGINQTKLKAGFRSIFGETIQEFRSRIRMQQAVRMIEDSDLPMSEIGRQLGFAHAANFTQAVKKHCGQTPLSIRKVRRE